MNPLPAHSHSVYLTDGKIFTVRITMAVASTMHILIVEDHSLVREFFAYLIRSIRSDTCIVEAGNAAEALAAAPTRRFAFVLFGLPTGDQAHLMALQALRRHSPDALLAFISAQADSESMIKALSMGACACLPKSANSQCVRQWLKQLFADQMAMPRVVKGLLGETTQDTTAAAGSTPPNLTGRQSEVLALVVAGLPNKLIARKLEIAESTVKLHVSAILRELKVTSRTQAMATVAKDHLVLPVIHDLGAPRARQAPRSPKAFRGAVESPAAGVESLNLGQSYSVRSAPRAGAHEQARLKPKGHPVRNLETFPALT